jgi:hypothetical protein
LGRWTEKPSWCSRRRTWAGPRPIPVAWARCAASRPVDQVAFAVAESARVGGDGLGQGGAEEGGGGRGTAGGRIGVQRRGAALAVEAADPLDGLGAAPE